jgi:hypothetical protein
MKKLLKPKEREVESEKIKYKWKNWKRLYFSKIIMRPLFLNQN